MDERVGGGGGKSRGQPQGAANEGDGIDELKRRVAALEAERNAARSTINWRFTATDARTKLGTSLSQAGGAQYYLKAIRSNH